MFTKLEQFEILVGTSNTCQGSCSLSPCVTDFLAVLLQIIDFGADVLVVGREETQIICEVKATGQCPSDASSLPLGGNLQQLIHCQDEKKR